MPSSRVVAVCVTCAVGFCVAAVVIAVLLKNTKRCAQLIQINSIKAPFCAMYYINLAHRRDRREHMDSMLATLGLQGRVQRFEAKTPSDPLAQQLERLFPDKFKGQYGCAASHLTLWRQAAVGLSNGWTLIMEDDIDFNHHIGVKDVIETMDKTTKLLPKTVGFIQFSVTDAPKFQKPAPQLTKKLGTPVVFGAGVGFTCYAIRADFARELTDFRKWKTPVIDVTHLGFLKSRKQQPSCVTFVRPSQRPRIRGLFTQIEAFGSDIRIKK